MSVNSIIQSLVMVDECETYADVTAEVERLLASYKFDYYGVLRQPKPSEDPMGLVLAGRWPDGWPDVYIAKKYVLVDPTIRYLGRSQGGFRWRDTIAAFRGDPQRKHMERMMLDGRNYGLEDGYIFPVHGRSGLLGNMTVGGRAVDLSPVEVALFDAVAKKVFWRYVALTGQAEALHRAASVDTMLTRREMEVLTHLSDGMTSNEISKILKISNHTVDWYMNGIQDKLKAKNRQHVVALAFRLGLVS